MRKRNLLVSALALALVISLVASVGASEPGELQSVDPGLLRAVNAVVGEDRCVAHELNTPGQGLHFSGTGLHFSGTTGGLIRGSITFTDPALEQPNTTLTPVLAERTISDTGSPPGTPFLPLGEMAGDVVIVVADDFAGGAFRLPSDLDDPAAGTTTLARLKALAESGELSHGALVMHHLNALIASLPSFTVVDADRDYTVWLNGDAGHHVVVAGLDLAEAVSSDAIAVDVVADALVKGVNGVVSRFDMLDLPGGDTLSPEGVVVNMSWVFLPCSSIEEFLANKDAYPTFEDYVNGLGITGYDFDEVVRALGYVGDGALVGFLDGGSFEFMSPKAALVAASGNFGMGYQMLPAGWRQVVGVAVRREEQRDFPGRYSNSGDVTVAGEWVGFQPLTLDGALGDPTILSYAGTSYAAPLVSLYAALDLSRSAPQCRHLQPNEPPLTKSPELDVPLVDAIGAC